MMAWRKTAWSRRSPRRAWAALAPVLVATIFAATPALAQKQYGPGVTDTEIKIGTTTPYSGPPSAYSAGAVSPTAYFTIINERGVAHRPHTQFTPPHHPSPPPPP